MACQESGNTRRFFFDGFDQHFFDLRLGAPVRVVARQHQIACALPTDELVGARADFIIVKLITVFFRRRLADDESIVQAFEQYRVGLFGRYGHSVIVGSLDTGHFVKIGRLQTLAVFDHAVERKQHVFRRERRAVVKAAVLAQVKEPFSPLKLPRLGQHADIFAARIVHFDQRLDDVLPNAADAAAAVGIRVKRIQADALKHDDAIFRGGERGARARGDGQAGEP